MTEELSPNSPDAAAPGKHENWRALLAALLSAVIAGAGQWYSRRWLRGALFFVPVLALGVAGAVIQARGLITLLELLVQPRVLWLILVLNVALLVWRSLAVIDAYRLRGGRRSAVWSKVLVGLIVLAVAAPHLVAVRYSLEGIHTIETVFAGESDLPSAQDREAALLAAGVPEEELGPLLTTRTFAPQDPLSPEESLTRIPHEDLKAPAPVIVPRDADYFDAPFLPVEERIGKDRITVLLAGGDAGPGRGGLRTDTMMVATMDITTGKGAILAMSRDLSRVPLPPAFSNSFREMEISFARRAWEKSRPPPRPTTTTEPPEDGEPPGEEPKPPPTPKFRAPRACKCFVNQLNAIYPFTRNWVRTFPNEVDPGMAALRETAEHLLKIKIDFYVLVDMAGFVELVDAIGGVDLYVEKPMHIAFSAPVEGGEKALINVGVGENHLDGLEALAYVRSRYHSSDYTRMRRQRCMLRSIAAEATPSTLVSSFTAIAEAVRNSVTTDIPVSFLPEFITLASKLRVNDIETVAFQPSYYAPTRDFLGHPIPDVSRIRSKVKKVLNNVADPTVSVAAEEDECVPRVPKAEDG